MATVTMTFDNIDLSNLIEINDIQRNVGNNRNVLTSDSPKIGSHVQGVMTDSKIITVDFSIWTQDRNTLKHKLAGIFNVETPKRLVFSDEPDKYYLALPVETTDMIEVSNYLSQGSIKFFIPDGVAHSSTYKRVVDYTKEGNVLTFQVENNGNVDAYPVINIKNNEESGYFGVVNQTGVLAIGNIDEPGTETFKRTEYLIDFKSNNDVRFTTNQGIFNDSAWALTGGLGFINRDGRTFTKMTRINSRQGQNGVSMTFEIPPDSNGEAGSLFDYLRWRQAFELVPNAQGIFKITVTDDNDDFMYGIQAVKYTNDWQGYYDILGRNDEGASTVIKRHRLKTTNKIGENPLCLKRGNSDLRRVDDKLTAYWDTKYYDYYLPAIKGKKSKKIHVLFGNFGAKPYPDINYLEWFRYAKDFVVKERDVKNRYAMGSNIILNCETNTVSVDGQLQANDVVHGSHFISIPPGRSELKVYLSDWVVKTPTISINFEERWL